MVRRYDPPGSGAESCLRAIEAYGGSTATYQVGPQWLGKLLDDERYFHDAGRVTLGVMGPKYDYNHPFTDDDLVRMIPHLNAFRHFNQLDLAGSAVSDAGLAQLKRLRRLKILSLGGTKVSDAGLKELQELGNLEELNLVATQITPAGIEQLRRALPNCTIEY